MKKSKIYLLNNFIYRNQNEYGEPDYTESDKKKFEKFKKIMNFEDPLLTIKTLSYIYLLMKVSSWIGDRFILFVALNIFVFYAPINKKFPHFLFVSRMSIKQVIEGTLGIVECLIPRYEEEKIKKK